MCATRYICSNPAHLIHGHLTLLKYFPLYSSQPLYPNQISASLSYFKALLSKMPLGFSKDPWPVSSWWIGSKNTVPRSLILYALWSADNTYFLFPYRTLYMGLPQYHHYSHSSAPYTACSLRLLRGFYQNPRNCGLPNKLKEVTDLIETVHFFS